MATESPHLLYAAGLFDGEGSISLISRKDRFARRLCVSLASTDRGLCDFMAETFGGKVYDHGIRSNRQKRIYGWQICNIHAVRFLKILAPHLKETRKKTRANLVITKLAPFFEDPKMPGRKAVEEEILAI